MNTLSTAFQLAVVGFFLKFMIVYSVTGRKIKKAIKVVILGNIVHEGILLLTSFLDSTCMRK